VILHEFSLSNFTDMFLPLLSSSQHSDQNNAHVYRYFNVIGSDPEGRLGEAPQPELREHGRISGACFDAARGIIPGLKQRITIQCWGYLPMILID
jgi:hypothetical protein